MRAHRRIDAVRLVVSAALAVAAAGAISGTGTPAAQSGAPAGLPDVVGFRTGVPLQEAYAALKAYNTKIPVKPGETVIPEISDRKLPFALLVDGGGPYGERLGLDITLPPSAQVVWHVGRQVDFEPGSEPTRTNIVAALRTKYGPEYAPDTSSPPPTLAWFFDQHGNRAVNTGDLYRYCFFELGGSEFGAGPTTNLLQPTPLPWAPPQGLMGAVEKIAPTSRPCRTLISLFVSLDPRASDQTMVGRMIVGLTDVNLRALAFAATYDRIMATRAGQQQQEREKAQQRPVPKI